MYENNYLAWRLSAPSEAKRAEDFLVLPQQSQRLTYDDFFLGAEKMAHVIQSLGLKADDRVLVYTGKSANCLQLYFACLIGGFIYVPINPELPIEDLSYFISDAEPALVICSDDNAAHVSHLLTDKAGVNVLTLNTDESGTLALQRDLQTERFTAVKRTGSDIAAILYTSGTTGRPKGAVHTHHSLWSNAETLTHCWRFSSSDVLIHALPIFHLHGLFTATNLVLASGAKCRFLPRFDAQSVLSEMPHATVLMGVPPFYMQLLKQADLTQAAAGMRLFISGSAPMLPQTHSEWRERTGKTILERYGMTEASMIASNPYAGDRKPNSVGFPLPGVEVRIVDMQTGQQVDAGDVGMIQIRGPNLFAGYWRKPEKTAEDMTSDGFFISGDFGRYDKDAYLYVLCRAKDAILTPSGIVLPKEVEELIDSDPAVAESAVIGVPSQSGSVLPVAIIVAKPGANISISQIEARISGQLEAYQRPARYIELEQMPRNAMGKVQKAALRETFADSLSTPQVNRAYA